MAGDFKKLDRETKENGDQVAFKATGVEIRLFANGTIAEADYDGKMKLQISPDGSMLEFLKNGSKKQTKGNGDTLITLPDGTMIQHKAGSSISLTRSPGGYMLQVDASTGIKIHKFPDGAEIHEYPDATIDVSADGVKKQTNLDGTVIEEFPDGKKTLTLKNGEVKDITPPKQ